MKGPDLEAVLTPDKSDPVLIEGKDECSFSFKNPNSDRWHHKSTTYFYCTQWTSFRPSDLVTVISQILNREIQTVDQAIAACQTSARPLLMNAEDTFLAQEKAAKEKAAREKAAQERAAQEKAAHEKAAQEIVAQMESAARDSAAQAILDATVKK